MRAPGFPVIALLGALCPPAWADIYKWTDEDGRTVYSNIRPAAVKSAEVVMEEDASPAPRRASVEQELLDRMARLERLVLSQQYRPPAAPAPAYDPPPAYPPPSYFAPAAPAYYAPPYYPPYYGFAPPISYVVVRPAFAPRFAHFHAVRGHR
jgi:hypothetical protein